jgi:hypothetical protein
MANIFIVGKKGSKSRRAISDNTGIRLYKGGKADAIVNYGLSGIDLRKKLNTYSSARRTPIINGSVGLSKYLAVKDAGEKGILVPESRLSLSRLAKLSDWIEKRVHSSQGKGIIAARGRNRIDGKYYQKMVKDRRFELRVHAFLWMPKEEWRINKRHGPAEQIAWNYHQGGHFQSVRYPNKYNVFKKAKDIAEKILKMRGMAFGAVDLIVDNDMKVYFIEVNASPGFTEFNQEVYFSAMRRLSEMSAREVAKFGR